MICSKCQLIFNQESTGSATAPNSHHPNLSSLQHSVRAYCPICTHLWKIIFTPRQSSLEHNNRSKDPQSLADDLAVQYYFSTTPDAYATPQVCFSTTARGHVTDLYLVDSPAPRHCKLNMNLSESTNCQDTLEIAKTWLHKCLTTHDVCSRPKTKEIDSPKSPNFLPSRVIQVIDQKRYRLLESASFPASFRYLTLSHCWGKERFFTLLSSNIQLLKQDIPVSQLSPVFRDALSVTSILGYEFLWIDSLCIIQDSIGDWNLESANMGSIYKNSACTLAATGFADGRSGLFATRNPADVQPLPVKVNRRKWSKEAEEESIMSLHGIFPDIWDVEVENSPLYGRAWVVQERILSPRILHFTTSQIYWECCEKRCSEVYPEGMFEKFRVGSMGGGQFVKFDCKTYSLFTGLPKHQHLEQVEKRGFQLGFMNAVVESHSRSKLTFNSDKLVSLAGIANELETLFDDVYLAGMFYKQLPHALLWNISYQLCPAVRRQEHGAPTWSWASIDGPINPWLGVKLGDIDLNYHPPILANVAKIITSPKARNLASSLKAFSLGVKGNLFQLAPASQVFLNNWLAGSKRSTELWNGIEMDTSGHRTIKIAPDTDEFFEMATNNSLFDRLYFLPIIGGGNGFPEIECLMLIPSREHKGEFQRIGYMAVSFEVQSKYQFSEDREVDTDPWWDGLFIQELGDCATSESNNHENLIALC